MRRKGDDPFFPANSWLGANLDGVRGFAKRKKKEYESSTTAFLDHQGRKEELTLCACSPTQFTVAYFHAHISTGTCEKSCRCTKMQALALPEQRNHLL